MEKARPAYKIVNLRLCQEQKSSNNTPICGLRKSWMDQRKTRSPWKGLYNPINQWKPYIRDPQYKLHLLYQVYYSFF